MRAIWNRPPPPLRPFRGNAPHTFPDVVLDVDLDVRPKIAKMRPRGLRANDFARPTPPQ
jgi:hypothetical protein